MKIRLVDLFNIITGSDGADTLTGISGPDSIDGLGGNDSLSGSADDSLYGGFGNDTLTGNSTKFGGDGDDYVDSARGAVSLDNGDDFAISSGENAMVDCGLGNDIVTMYGGGSRVYGRDGNDDLRGYGSIYYGGGGNDTISIANGLFSHQIKAFGQDGNDYFYGGEEIDIVSGGDGNDAISGNGGNDTLFGGDGNDSLGGGGRKCQVFGGDGDDSFYGSNVLQTVTTGRGADRIEIWTDKNVEFIGIKVTDFTHGVDVVNMQDWVQYDHPDMHFVGEADFDGKIDAIRFNSATKSLQFDFDGDGLMDESISLGTRIFTAEDLIL